MLEGLEMNRKMDKKTYKEETKNIGARLGKLQREFRNKKIPFVIILEGLGGSGKGRLINKLLLYWDPRGYSYHYVKLSPEEKINSPLLNYYGSKAPLRGEIAIYGRSWYRELLDRGVEYGTDDRYFKDIIKMGRDFENQLVDDGALIVKFFLHISKNEQTKRLLKRKKDPSLAWSVTEYDWHQNDNYDRYIKIFERIFQETDSERSPWIPVVADDRRYALFCLLSIVKGKMERRLSLENKEKTLSGHQRFSSPHGISILENIDLTRSLEKMEYKKKLKIYQKKLHSLELEIIKRKLPVIVLFEGIDAAGKGGAIKRLVKYLYPRNYEVIPVGSPDNYEKDHHYLWRFWREIPANGEIKIFDRSWYGRVLVERVEKIASVEEWQRAYREINEFEDHLGRFNTVIVKFWLQIDRKKQFDRFMARKKDPEKSWKLTDEDWRNRENWDLYMNAANEMIFKTDTDIAPWTVVEGNSKKYARIKVLKTVCEAVERAIQKR